MTCTISFSYFYPKRTSLEKTIQLWGGGWSPTPFFPKKHRNLDLGMEKIYKKRGKQSLYLEIEKIPFFLLTRQNLDLGMGKDVKKCGKKHIWKLEREENKYSV